MVAGLAIFLAASRLALSGESAQGTLSNDFSVIPVWMECQHLGSGRAFPMVLFLLPKNQRLRPTKARRLIRFSIMTLGSNHSLKWTRRKRRASYLKR